MANLAGTALWVPPRKGSDGLLWNPLKDAGAVPDGLEARSDHGIA